MSHEEELLGVLTRVAEALEHSAKVNKDFADYVRNRDAAAEQRREEAATSGEDRDTKWQELACKRLELDQLLFELQERALTGSTALLDETSSD